MTSKKICSIEECSNIHLARGYCSAHYQRLRRYGSPHSGRVLHGKIIEFFENIVLKHEGNDCLTWPFSTTEKGYPTMTLSGTTQRVGRLICLAEHGPPPTPRHEAAHSCGNGHLSCVARKHLRWATHTENLWDKIEHDTHQRGERHPLNKLTESDVLEIRALRGTLVQREVAEIFGISRETVSQIQRRERWAWLE